MVLKVGLSNAELEQVLQRCRRRRRLTALVRGFELWSRAAWPGLIAVALLAIALRTTPVADALGPHALRLLGVGAFGWLALVLWVPYAKRRRLWLAPWVLPAWLDRAAGAQGALMQRFENRALKREVPRAVLAQRFAPLFPWRVLGGWALVCAIFAAVGALPPVQRAATLAQQGGSVRVERTRRTIEALARVDPEASAFVESAQKSLSMLDSKAAGLERADFEALERMDESAERLLQRQAQQLDARRAALDSLDSLIASHEAQQGDPTMPAGALAEQLGRVRQELDMLGDEQSKALQELLKQAQQQAEAAEKKEGSEGQPQRGAFDPEAVRQLREAMGELREITTQQAEALAQASPGPGKDDGPQGPAPLELSHQTKEPWGARFDPQLFRTQNDDQTVLLATGTSQRADDPVRDTHGQSTRQFDERSDTAAWHKRVLPRHRPVLETYFGGDDGK